MGIIIFMQLMMSEFHQFQYKILVYKQYWKPDLLNHRLLEVQHFCKQSNSKWRNHMLPCPRIKIAFAAKGVRSWIFSPAKIVRPTSTGKNANKFKILEIIEYMRPTGYEFNEKKETTYKLGNHGVQILHE